MTDHFADHDPAPDDQVGVELRPVAERLARERPVPRAAFRSELGRQLLGRPIESRARLLIFAYGTPGAALLAVAVIGVAGVGPLAAG